MKNLLLILIITLPLILWGQGWEQTYGGIDTDWGYSVQQTTDGGYIITGWTSSFGNGSTDVWLIKTDGNGNELWTKTFGGTDIDRGYSVQQTTDGGYIITGLTYSFGNGNTKVYLIKTDGNGNELWTKIFGIIDGVGQSIQQTQDGGYIITGWTYSTGNNSYDVYLLKTDENGNELWSQTFGGIVNDYGYSVQQTTDSGYIITGWNFINDFDVYLIKTDLNGDELWSKTFGGMFDDYGFSVQQTMDGGYIITGYQGTMLGGNDKDIFLIKTDGNGNELWTKTFGGTGDDLGYSVQQTTDGGYILTGLIDSTGTFPSADVCLIKTDDQGNEMWIKRFGGIGLEVGYSVQQTQDGGYIITGLTSSFGIGQFDVYLIKTDGQGNITSTFEIPLPNPNRKLEKTVNLKGQEIKPQTNTPIIEVYDDGSVEKKLIVD